MRPVAQQKKSSFFGGVATMAIALALVKVIGAVYKIPIVGMLGDKGYASFDDAYQIYGILLTVSTAGLPAAVSRMVAANHALGRDRQVQKVFRTALGLFFVLGMAGGLFMLFGADWFSAQVQRNPYAAPGIRALAPAVVCVCCMGAFRGYFQGHSNMRPSAASQVIEAGGKLVILAVALVFLGGTCSAEFALFGVTLGSALAVGYMALAYLRFRPRTLADQPTDATGDILKDLLKIAVPITLTSSAVSIINFIDPIVVKGRLQDALGYSVEDSLALYGTYAAVKNIYNLPASLIMAVTVSVIPAVSAALAVSKRREAARLTKASLHITALLVFPMGAGIAALAGPIVQMLFPRLDPALAGPLLSVLGLASIFVCLVSVSNSVIQSYGRQNLPVVVMVCAGTVMLVIDYILVGMEGVNIFGSPVGTLCCYVVAAVVDFVIIRRIVPHPPRYFRLFFGPALATAVMALVARGSYRLARLALGNTLSLLFAILCAVAVYAFLVVWLKMLSRSELQLMPKGDKLADLLKLP